MLKLEKDDIDVC